MDSRVGGCGMWASTENGNRMWQLFWDDHAKSHQGTIMFTIVGPACTMCMQL